MFHTFTTSCSVVYMLSQHFSSGHNLVMIENVDYKVINGESSRSLAKRQHDVPAFLYL